MASFLQYTASGGASQAFSISSFTSDEIKVYVDNVLKTAGTGTTAGSSHDYELQSYTVNGGTIAWVAGKLPANPAVVRIIRDTDISTAKATYSAGSSIKAGDLNDNQTQVLRSLEEQDDQLIQTYDIEDNAVTTAKIKDGTVVNADISSTAEIAVSKLADGSARQVLQTAANGSDVEWTSNVDIPGTLDVTSTAQFDGNVNITGATGVDGNFDVNTNKFTVAADTGNTVIAGNLDVTGQFDVTGTSNYTGQQTVPGGALVKNIRVGLDAANEVSTTSGNLVLDSATGTVAVDDALTVAGSLTVTGTTNLANNSIGTAEIAADAIDGTKLADNACNSEHYTDGSIDRVHLEADIIDSTKLADNAVNSEHYVNGSIDHVHLANNIINGDNIVDDAVNSEHIAAGALDNEHYAAGSITSDKLNAATVVTNSEQASASANDTSFFTTSASDARYFNVSTGDTIKDGQTFPDNDTTIATTAAINDRIIDLVDDVGGFVPIANETSFPAANPDVNNGAGTLVSIKALASNLTSNGSGVATIANGAGSGNTVTINGLANSTTYTATFGMIVETTSTLHTYTFHRLVPKATEVTTVAGSISNVNTVAGDISNVNTVAGNNSNVTTVAGVSGNVTTVAGISSNVTTVAGIASDVTAVAGDATDIGAVAAKATEIGRLGTADAVADMNTLGTNAIVSDLDTCATSISNINTTAGSIANVNTVASNMGTVNDFAARYRTGANNPTSSLDVGDLFFNTSANELKVYNGSAWQGGVTASGSFASVTGNTFTGDNLYNDGVKAKFGTGSDLQIYHDGSNSYQVNTTGSLVHRSTGEIYIQSDSGIRLTDVGNNETFLKCIDDGAVELYYDNSKKRETNSTGISVTGGILTTAGSGFSGTATFSADVMLDGTSTNFSGGNTAILWDKSEDRLEFADSTKLSFGQSYDLQIYHDSNNSVIENSTGQLYIKSPGGINIDSASEQYIHCTENGNVQLYYDDVKRFETYNSGCIVNGHLYLTSSDSHKLILGAGSDLQIYHNGTNSFIENSTGSLYIRDTSGGDIRIQGKSGEDSIICHDDGGVDLYHDGTKRFETTANGINIKNSSHPSSTLTSAPAQLTLWNNSDHNWDHNEHAGALIFRKGTGTGTLNNIVAAITGTHTRAGTGMSNEDGGLQIWISPNANPTVPEQVWEFDHNGHFLGLDNHKIRFGDSTDLEIYHDGSDSYISHNGAGHLNIQTAGSQESIKLKSQKHISLYVEDGTEVAIQANESGSVELYYDGSKKLETYSGGVDISGDIVIDGAAGGTLTLGGSAAHTSKVVIADNAGNGNGNLLVEGGDGTDFFTINSAGNVKFEDSKKAIFGAGDDLQIYHNGAASYIQSPSHTLYIQATTIDIGNGAGTEPKAKFFDNGAVELYYDGSKKAETTSSGFDVTGTLTTSVLTTDGTVTFSSTSNNVNFTGASSHAVWIPGSNAFRFNDNTKALFGTGNDLEIYHDASNSWLKNNTGVLVAASNDFQVSNVTGQEELIRAYANGAVNLRYDNSTKLATTSSGVSVTGGLTTTGASTFGEDITLTGANYNVLWDKSNNHIQFNDSAKVRFGTSGDLQIYHSGSHSYIKDTGTGVLYIDTNDIRIKNAAEDEYLIRGVQNQGIKLYYDGVKKFETLSDGVDITGTLKVNGTAFASGSTVQVVQGTTSTSSSIGTGWGDTGLSCSITTQKANSKILVQVSQPVRGTTGDGQVSWGMRILRGSTTIHNVGGSSGHKYSWWTDHGGGSDWNWGTVSSFHYLDSPSASAGTSYTYKTQAAKHVHNQTTTAQGNSMTSIITLTEISN